MDNLPFFVKNPFIFQSKMAVDNPYFSGGQVCGDIVDLWSYPEKGTFTKSIIMQKIMNKN